MFVGCIHVPGCFFSPAAAAVLHESKLHVMWLRVLWPAVWWIRLQLLFYMLSLGIPLWWLTDLAVACCPGLALIQRPARCSQVHPAASSHWQTSLLEPIKTHLLLEGFDLRAQLHKLLRKSLKYALKYIIFCRSILCFLCIPFPYPLNLWQNLWVFLIFMNFKPLILWLLSMDWLEPDSMMQRLDCLPECWEAWVPERNPMTGLLGIWFLYKQDNHQKP